MVRTLGTRLSQAVRIGTLCLAAVWHGVHLFGQQYESAFEHYTINKANPILQKNAYLAVESPTGFVKLDYPIGPGLSSPRGGLHFQPTARVHLIPKNAPREIRAYNVGGPPVVPQTGFGPPIASSPQCFFPEAVRWRAKLSEAYNGLTNDWWIRGNIEMAPAWVGAQSAFYISWFDFNAGTSSVWSIDPGHAQVNGLGQWGFILPTGESVSCNYLPSVADSGPITPPHEIYTELLSAFGYS
ncbi:MAG: hypothetical protein LWX11_02680, partial [Firmicutes bacterium]|nr:hypothetical protein [Bacillota bacterium]